jgi:hypothetical protein
VSDGGGGEGGSIIGWPNHAKIFRAPEFLGENLGFQHNKRKSVIFNMSNKVILKKKKLFFET